MNDAERACGGVGTVISQTVHGADPDVTICLPVLHTGVNGEPRLFAAYTVTVGADAAAERDAKRALDPASRLATKV